MPGILVGVDGSDHSRHALRWAMREAAEHHVPLTVMAVRPAAVRPATEIFWNIPELPEGGLSEEQERASLRQFVDQVESESGEKPDEITYVTVTGDPAQQLIQASYDADLLVVGTRGNGGFVSLLLGSVSSKCMHHAACPTVVVPRNRGAHD